MLFKKLLRTIWHYKAQFFSMIIMVALGIGVFVGFQGEWYSIERDTYSFYDETGFADYRLISEEGYSVDDLSKIKNIDGVKKAARYLSIKTNETKDNDVLSLTITSDYSVSGFLVMEGKEYDKNSKDGVWISDQYANKNSYKIGDDIKLKYGSLTLTGKIKGLIKSSEYLICVPDENQMMPDFEKYGYVYISPAMLKENLGMEFYSEIHVLSDLTKREFIDNANKALGKTNLILTKDEVVSFAQAQGEAEEGKTMASILPVIFLGIAILIMATTMQRLAINEKTQIGTLKALGFKDKKITMHYCLFGFFIGVVGAGLGIGIGYYLAWFIFNPNGSMGTYFDIPSWKIYMPDWTFVVVAIMVVIMTVVSYISAKNMLKGTAAMALQPYTPKVMNRLKIEDSSSWRKLKFATKWNLRDLFRHKARSIMSLFGVFGCMVLLVASFLMMDSMVGFVNKFYYGSMNYKSQISLKEDTNNDEALEIINNLKCDYSSSNAVSFNDEGISMDIYNVKNNYVRFLDDDMNYVEIKDNGIYLGQRLIEEYDLKVGDSFKVSLYGSDKTYEFKIAGTLRTLTKGIVMSEKYAKQNNVEYRINQLYSDKNIEEIQKISYMKNISSLKSRDDVIKSFDSFMEVMYTMIGALILLSIILGIIVLYNLGTMSYFERYRELSTLKVVGFKDRQIGKLLISQNIWITVFGIILGFPTGIWITSVLTKALASEYEMKIIFGWKSVVIPVILVFITSLFVSFMVSRKNKNINMVEALKVAE